MKESIEVSKLTIFLEGVNITDDKIELPQNLFSENVTDITCKKLNSKELCITSNILGGI